MFAPVPSTLRIRLTITASPVARRLAVACDERWATATVHPDALQLSFRTALP